MSELLFFNDTATTEIYTLSLHDALPIAVEQDGLQAGLDAAPRVLDALEDLAAEGFVLVPGQATLADCHLWPMMDYALMVPEIAEMVGRRSALAAWCAAMSGHPAAIATAPDLKALRI